jgi:hypothetical protein
VIFSTVTDAFMELKQSLNLTWPNSAMLELKPLLPKLILEVSIT